MTTKESVYNQYKDSLVEYSKCMKPVIQALGERYINQVVPSKEPIDFNSYCGYERKKVNEFRNILKHS